jgi:hypothetical protein
VATLADTVAVKLADRDCTWALLTTAADDALADALCAWALATEASRAKLAAAALV